MKTFDQQAAGRVIYELTAVIQKNRDYLSEIDGATGDGDHGVNMNKGFTKCREQLEGGGEGRSLSEAMDLLGDILLSEIGGSMGPLYGTFFMEMAENIGGKAQIGAEDFLGMLKAGLAGIRALVPTEIGDKTLLDVLVPSVAAFETALAVGKDFDAALDTLKVAAAESREATKDMVAKVGRASRLGERSRGFYDAGATSCALILASLADSVQALLR
ncbi:MAG: dihydroxyacetone kinase subunit L [Clostridiales bacterium]|jgi:dihydroxyacetone kinase-like protein|nr:dihydroxyacetone kinase subunit L [Clostridiales bacterium]